jgi:hypothetical protein
MCLILDQYGPDVKPLHDDEIVDVYSRNSNGWGAIWHDTTTGSVVTVKDLPQDAEHAIRLYRSVPVKAVHHWRYSTSGRETLHAAHPFTLQSGIAFMHNGVLPDPWGSLDESDTQQLARILDRLVWDAADLDDPAVAAMLQTVARGSVLTFALPGGEVRHLGREFISYNGRGYSNSYAWTMPGRQRELVSAWGDPRLYDAPTTRRTAQDDPARDWADWHRLDGPEEIVEFLSDLGAFEDDSRREESLLLALYSDDAGTRRDWVDWCAKAANLRDSDWYLCDGEDLELWVRY